MHFDLKGALKSYRRMRAWRHCMMFATVIAALVAAWAFALTRTDTLLCLLGALVLVTAGQIEMRLKTMQIRLAGMADEIDRLRGKEDEGNLILELNDW